jgi:hypothetical protein
MRLAADVPPPATGRRRMGRACRCSLHCPYVRRLKPGGPVTHRHALRCCSRLQGHGAADLMGRCAGECRTEMVEFMFADQHRRLWIGYPDALGLFSTRQCSEFTRPAGSTNRTGMHGRHCCVRSPSPKRSVRLGYQNAYDIATHRMRISRLTTRWFPAAGSGTIGR